MGEHKMYRKEKKKKKKVTPFIDTLGEK